MYITECNFLRNIASSSEFKQVHEIRLKCCLSAVTDEKLPINEIHFKGKLCGGILQLKTGQCQRRN
jgi:hypothetical protein